MFNLYSKTIGKADPDHMTEDFLTRIQQHMEDLEAFCFDSWSVIEELFHSHGRSKIALKTIKDQTRRDCDQSIKGCKRARVETGEVEALSRTQGVDADMHCTTYKRPGEPVLKLVRPNGPGAVKRKAEEIQCPEKSIKRTWTGKEITGGPDESKCLKCGKPWH